MPPLRAERELMLRIAVSAATALAPSAATAGSMRDYAVAAGRLDAVLAAVAGTAGFSVGTTLDLSPIRSAGVAGRLRPKAALAQALAGTGLRAVPAGPDGWRIVPVPVRRPLAPNPPIASTPTASFDEDRTIVVTASKRRAGLLRFPGSVEIVSLAPATSLRGIRDLQDFAAGLPILQTTNLGPGRNKLFVRGIADSSFVGPTRSTASVYFGDVQLGYGGPDPDLALVDVDRVEVLEGPQGALYGAGAIGGIVRISPAVPDTAVSYVRLAAQGRATAHGGPGYDLAATLSLPLIADRLAIRVVGYQLRDGGYIDELRRHLTDVNTTTTAGGRAAVRFTAAGWTVDAGALGQRITQDDAQYTIDGLPRLSRRTLIAQPASNRYLLGRLVVTHDWDSGLRLVSATGFGDRRSDDRTDATRPGRPNFALVYDTQDRNQLLTHETRLSRTTGRGNSWLLGVSVIDDHDRIRRAFGPPGAPAEIVGVSNLARDFSGFGEATLALAPRLSVTGGGRLTWTRTDGSPTFTRANIRYIAGRGTFRATPTVAVDWLVAPRLAWFARYGEGFRTGGLAVAPGVGRVANYDPDSIAVVETGVRLERRGARGVALNASLSRARWSRILADLVDRSGFPYTVNIGDGRLVGFDAQADWVPYDGVDLAAAMFVADSTLRSPVQALARQVGSALPNTPRVAATLHAGYAWTTRRGDALAIAADGRYTGRSVVGLPPALNLEQGGYATLDVGARWRRGAVTLSLGVDNATDTLGNRFALGNPFGLAARNQTTPLRPRTLRAGFAIEWR